MVDFVEICNVCVRKVIIEAANRIINSDKVCRSYSDLILASLSGTQCTCTVFLLQYIHDNMCAVRGQQRLYGASHKPFAVVSLWGRPR